MKRWRRRLILGPLGQVGNSPLGDLGFAVIRIGADQIAIIIDGGRGLAGATVVVADVEQFSSEGFVDAQNNRWDIFFFRELRISRLKILELLAGVDDRRRVEADATELREGGKCLAKADASEIRAAGIAANVGGGGIGGGVKLAGAVVIIGDAEEGFFRER